MEKFFIKFVRLLPKKLVYFCANEVLAYSTSGKYGTTEVPKITAMECLERYYNDNLKK